MTIRSKVLLTVALTFSGLIVVLLLLARVFVLGKFEDLELRSMETQLARARNLILSVVESIDVTTRDYASWDETYQFIETRNESYALANLVDETWAGLRMHCVAIVGERGEVVYQRMMDLETGRGDGLSSDVLGAILGEAEPVLHGGGRSKASGILMVSDRPLLFSSRPILTSQHEGPARGAFIMGRFLDQAEVARIGQVGEIALTVRSWNARALPENFQTARDALSAADQAQFIPRTRGNTQWGFSVLDDMRGRPALLVGVSAPRSLYAQGRTTLFYFVWSLVAAGLLFMGVNAFVLDKQFLLRLAQLGRRVQSVEAASDLGQRIAVGGDDEISALARQINRMLEALSRSEEGLRESEERYRLLFNQMTSAFVLYRSDSTAANGANDYRVVEVNPALERITGLRREDVVAKGLREILPGLEAHWFDKLEEVARNGRPCPFSDHVGPLRKHLEGVFFRPRPGLVAGVFNDVTARVNAQKERESLEAQMRQAQKLESLGVLAGGIAHDFNNLLMGILGNADLALLELPPDSPARGCLGEVAQAAQRAAELCRQMLAYSGKGRFVVRAVNLNEVVREMGHLLESAIAKRARVEYCLAGGLPTIEADATQIRQVLMNLLTNAAEAMGEAKGRIVLRTSARQCTRADLVNPYLEGELAEGEYVCLEVSDTGCGMDGATLEKIFDPFFTTKFTGRGLGLAAVLGIVRGHRGALRVRSAPGQGTSFELFFPSSALVAHEAAAPPMPPEGWRGEGTALLVDDEETVRTVGRRMLERLGYSVLTAEDGVAALDLLRRHGREIRLVVLDLTMPRMDGEETFRLMRRMQGDLPIIVASGYDTEDLAERFAAGDATGFVQKPFTLTDLTRVLCGAPEA